MRLDLAQAAANASRALIAEHGRQELQGSLGAFMRAAWPWLEPQKPLIWGWHIDCILEHCEAVARGEIRTLLVNIPPRHLKSTLIAVIFPAWLWTRRSSLKMLTGSYAMPLAMRDATKTRRLITSPWYQRVFPEVQLQDDQTAKQRYDLIGGGGRYCFSTGGTVTGEGADILLFDDPHKADDMYSEPALETAVRFWSETLPSRLDDPERGSKIIIMQRLGERDLSGYILREAAEHKDSNVVHVCLPAHFDPARACKTRWFRDPRKEAGELLWPERMNARAIREMTRSMSPPAIAAQMEQEPTAKGGSILKRPWWRVWTDWGLPKCEAIIISVDPSMKGKEENDPWACTVWGAFQQHEPAPEGSHGSGTDRWSILMLNSWSEHMGYPEAKAKVLQTYYDYTIHETPPTAVLIEDKAAGPVLIDELERAGIESVTPWPPKGYQFPDKVSRAKMMSALLYHGRVYVPGRKLPDRTRSAIVLQPFAEKVVAQCEIFPAGDHDDLVDTATQAWWYMRDQGFAALDTDTLREHQPMPMAPRRARESIYG